MNLNKVQKGGGGMSKIVIFKDEKARVANFYECLYFEIYEKKQEEFCMIKQKHFDKIIPSNPQMIREKVNNLIEIIGDCKVAAFGEITGIPYATFDAAGFYVFQIENFEVDTLNGIFSDLEELEKESRDRKEVDKIPVETEIPGVFTFDMIRAQEIFPDLSTKKVLLPFFESTPFMELKLNCIHIPPWLEKDERFVIESENTNKGIMALITHKQCFRR